MNKIEKRGLQYRDETHSEESMTSECHGTAERIVIRTWYAYYKLRQKSAPKT